MSDFSFIGKPTPLIDGDAKISGKLKFTGDLKIHVEADLKKVNYDDR